MGNIWEFFFYTGKHILVNEMIAFKDLDLRKTRENQITEKNIVVKLKQKQI